MQENERQRIQDLLGAKPSPHSKLIFETNMSNDNEVLVKVEGVSKMLNGLLKPDAGRIKMRGRIGAGFNPILNACGNRLIPSLIFTS